MSRVHILAGGVLRLPRVELIALRIPRIGPCMKIDFIV